MRICIPATFLSLLGITLPVLADTFDPPAGYYDTATGTGSTLKGQLHDIIDDHTVLSYGDARSSLQVTDVDPADPDRLILVYDRQSLDVSGLISSPGIPGWDSGDSWNREHTWPRSRGVNSSGPDNSDLHQLRPSDPGVNSNRSNLNFGGGFGQSFGRVTDGGNEVWYPGDADAGMIARQQFYMAVRYDGSDSNTTDLELAAGNPGTSNLGDLDRLLEWHYQAPPDEFERRRNDVIFDDYQGNRNPFVDRPEFVHSVFVDNANDTGLTLDGGVSQPDGSSVLNVDFGSVIVGASNPTQTVTLNKTGVDGTYYSINTSGFATSSVGGRLNAFGIGSSATQDIEIGVAAPSPFATNPGEFSGTVTIDNLDVTTGGGMGVGASDGDDVVNLQYTVLDHAQPTLVQGGAIVQDLTLDFGVVEQDAQDVTLGAVIGNVATSDFVSGLDFDFSTNDGDNVFFSDLSVFTGLAAGESVPVEFGLFTDTLGTFSRTITLFLSDEDLPGAMATPPLTITLLAEVVAGQFIFGDYNGDGFVSQPDLDLVLLNWGDAVPPDGWMPNDQFTGVMSQNELDGVLLNWGDGSPPTLSIPEPATLTTVALLGLPGYRRRRP